VAKKQEPPRVSVIERRLQNPFGEPSNPIQFKEPGKIARWFNAAIMADKIWRAKNKGWSVVYPADLVDLDQVGGFTPAPDGGYITRGDRGQEVLMWMWQADFDAIALAKARANTRNMGNPTKNRNEALEAFGRVNANGADWVDSQGKRSGPVGGVTDQYERIERRLEDEG
jgi:hypothetical protein